jgi:hypothetical protein
MSLDFLLRNQQRTGDAMQLKAVTYTLTKMARGGIYDQLGGGFHRYSTDAHWLVPHFEKMLYDNAQLARTYLHAWQVTGNAEFRRIVEETLDYVLREMTSPKGGFYSTQDADSEGVEGKFFLWTPAEVAALLPPDEAALFCGYFDVTSRGNFHEAGRPASILHVADDLEDAAARLRISEARLAEVIARGRQALLAARAKRIPPGRDDKILAEWNGLMLHAFAEAGAVLDRPDYIAAAERAAAFIVSQMSDGKLQGADSQSPISNLQYPIRLFRTYNAGRAHLTAYLEDYAAVGVGLVGLYEATFDLRWLEAAQGVAEAIVMSFSDPAGSGFFQTAADAERLIARRKDFVDNAVPAGNSLAAELFLRLGRLLDRPEYTGHAEGLLRLLAAGMAQQPLAFGRLLCALADHLRPGHEIAVIGDPGAADTQALLAELRRRYRPGDVLALAAPGDTEAQAAIPLLAGRTAVGGRATAYVCRDFVCNLPVTEAEALGQQLGW